MELLFEKMTLNDNDNVIFDKDCGLNNKNLILNGSSKNILLKKMAYTKKVVVEKQDKWCLNLKLMQNKSDKDMLIVRRVLFIRIYKMGFKNFY